MSTPSSIPSDISRTTAPLLVGALLNWLLYGVLIVQVYSYHQYFPRDKRYNKILVHAVFIIETVQTLLTGADISYRFISGFGNFERLQRTFLASVDMSILNLFVSITVRSFFCYRIWDIKKSLFWWCCVIVALSMVQCIGNMADGILGLKHGNIEGPHLRSYFIYIGLVSSAIADLAVTATLACLFSRGRKRESISSMEHASKRILRFTVETNLVAASISALCFVLFAAAPNDVFWFFPAVVIGKVYSVTLLVLFNGRISSRNACAHISTPRAGTPVRIEENSSRTWAFADYFVRRPSVSTSDVKSAPPFIVSFDQQRNFEVFSPSRSSHVSHQGQPRPFSIPSPQYPQALAPSLRRRIEVPLSASLRAKTALSRISTFGLPIRPLPRTPS